MSFWSDIYAGDATKIAQAFNEAEPVDGEPFVMAHVNLPGIIPGESEDFPNSPDLLTELACSLLGVEPFTFSESIVQQLGSDSESIDANRGAYVMASRWVELFATMTESRARVVAHRWLTECDPGAADAARASPLVSCLLGICEVCRVAQQHRVSLVYTWTL